MSVSNYTPINKYKLGKLEKVVYLIAEEDLRDIHIDNGYAYVDGVSATPLSLQVYNISLKDTDELDERYKFTHTLAFSMHGYANYTDFQGKYYAIVKSLDGVYWLVNPLFPCKVTYTYTLDGSGSHTDFAMATISNHPTLRLQGFNAPTPSNNCKYQRCTIDRLRLNEKEYTRKTGDIVRYTNDGFKDIVYLKNSAIFKETFDGNNISHSLDFNINFDDYKSSWHYNLLEFMNNRYAAIIKTSCGKYILTGFGFGLNPSFNVDASDTGIDTISISMSDLHDNGDFIWYDDSVTITTSSGTNFVYVTEYYQCVGDYLANYLLKEEVDAFGNPMGNYLVLDGHQSEFPNLNIVGTFEETEEFYNPDCEQCKLQTSFPLSFVFNTTVCRTYSLIGATDWTLSSSSNDVTVFPTSGEAETPYEIQICNNHTPSETAWTATITATYCNKTKQFNVTVIKGDGCFTAGQVFDISANGQYVIVPTQCCISSVTESTSAITNISVQKNYIRVFVPQNDTSSVRVFTLDVTFCDGGSGVVTINQGVGFEKWLFEYYVCSGGKKCEVWRKYTGLTAADCNEWTTSVRTQNCVDSADCSGTMTRWIDTTGTTCSNGRKYIIQEEQVSTDDDGETWSPTGSKRLGDETPDSPAECEGVEDEEEWRVVDDDYWCNDTTKYTKERLYTRPVGGEEWIATDIYRQGETILETNSEDCGFEVPSDSWQCEKWETVDGYICEETTKYNKEERFVRNCSGGCSACTSAETWISTGIYRKGSTVLETNSVDCGFVKPTDEYNCQKWETVDGYFCDGTTKYNRERLYLSDCPDCNNCSVWIGTDVYRKGSTVLATDSTDCGFIIGSDDWDCEKWELVDESEYYFCEETTKYKAEQRYVRNCPNGCNNCSETWVATGVYRRSNVVISYESTDCGFYVPSTAWTCEEWRVLSGLNDYICEETTKYAKEQRYVRNCSGDCSACTETWVATGVFRRSTIILEYNSEDCGYNPEISGNCVMWQWDDDTICDGFNKYQYLQKYVRDCDNCDACSSYWIPTGIYKRGELVQSNSLDCGYLPGGTYVRWENEDTQCYGYDLYEYWRKYVSDDNVQWYATDIYKQGDMIEENSFDCGYIPTEWTACTQWRAAGHICNGLDLYQRLRKFITDDCNRYYATNIYKLGELIEENSIDCGYIPVANYIKWEEDDFICDGYDKYERLRKYISDDNIRWYMTEIFKRGNLIELNSFDCGYIPVENCYRWELAGTRCNGYDKYQNLVKVISDDCDERWYVTNITKTGELIETNSPDCGYKPSILYEYRWVATDATTCYRYDLVFQYKKQRRRLFYLSAQWQDVIPTEYSVDGAGTLPIRFAAKDTADCGYAPTVIPIYKWENVGWMCDECGLEKKFRAEYKDGSVYELDCNSSSTLTSVETKSFSAYSRSAMTAAIIGDCVTSIGNYAFNSCSGLTSIDIPDSVTSIGEWAFSTCSALESITIPNSVTTIGNEAFQECTNLASITIPNGVTTIGWQTFAYCSGLTSIDIPNSVTTIDGYVFSSCISLISIDIPDSVTTIGNSAFQYCGGLTSVTIGNGVTTIGEWAFNTCSALESITIPNSVTTIGEWAFNRCISLISIDIPNSVTSIGNYAFRNCYGLTSCTIGSGVTIIGRQAFYGCRSLTSIDIPNSVTSIGDSAFYGCRGLTSCTIGSSVTSIGDSAFNGCSGLTSITCKATTPPTLDFIIFDFKDNCPIYVPSGSVNEYKSANYWSRYADRIVAIP